MIVAIAIASFGLSMVTFDVLRQQQSLKEQLVGTWTLLAWEQKKGDGTKVERYGTSPKGIAFFDAGGRYIITVMRSDRAKYASNAQWQGTAEKNKETADGAHGGYVFACHREAVDRAWHRASTRGRLAHQTVICTMSRHDLGDLSCD
jgi:hypothetical protein